MYPSPPRASFPASVLQHAQAWHAGGASPVPIAPGGLKRPATKWSDYQITAPRADQVVDWFGNGSGYGLAIIMGSVSGNLEMTEIEGVAARDTVLMGRIWDKIDEHDAYDIWHIVHNGYLEESPSGGLHFIYKISDYPVPGNEKIARRPATEAELTARPGDKIKVLAETRGEGGYVIVAPTSGLCHPSGEAWKLLHGEPGVVPTITWEQRQLLHRVLRDALDDMPAPPPQLPPTPTTVAHRSDGLSPGDDFERQMSWEQILMPAGWDVLARKATGETHWVRPGKDRREGMSATTGHAGDRDRLYVFSTSTEFQSEVPYTKFGAFAVLHHGGDHKAAARELARLGFGDRQVDVFDNAVEVPTPAAPVTEPQQRPRKFYRQTDTGNGQRLMAEVGTTARYVEEYKEFMSWTGTHWDRDFEGTRVHQAFMSIVEGMYREAKEADSEALLKWADKCDMEPRRNAAVSTFKKLPGVTVKVDAFDIRRDLLNLEDGIVNPKTRELIPHSPEYMMTRTLGASYRPEATCPTWDAYLATVLPDENMRRYVQRAMGYTLLGEPNRRSIFFLYGPGGTGKSTFLEVMQSVFGTYGATAAPGTFRLKVGEGPSNDLHGLRGKRFVSSSETTDSTSFEEDLLKRLAGNDSITSRDLYEKNQTWKPECVLWLATNHPPKFSSDDDALWQRTKLIPFVTKLSGTEQEVPDMTQRLIAESDGILNWLLAGVDAFLAEGLGEPMEVIEAATTQRAQSDPVQRFLEDRGESGAVHIDPQATIRFSELHQMYVMWARECGERALTFRRFNNRLADLPRISTKKSGGQMWWVGVGRAPGASILGTMSPG